MPVFIIRILSTLIHPFQSEKKLRNSFKIITGLPPVNLALYKQAMRHSSVATVNTKGIKDSYERLEYLGDAILGMVVAEYLFHQYPFKEEGFLTVIRSKIVNREALSGLAQKIGLKQLVQYNQGLRSHQSVFGDCMEALIGAVYLDYGFNPCKKFIMQKLIKPHYDLNELISTTTNFKSKLLEWSQKENKELKFEILSETDRRFTAQVLIDNISMEKGYGFSKKKAEQDAARKTFQSLKLDE